MTEPAEFPAVEVPNQAAVSEKDPSVNVWPDPFVENFDDTWPNFSDSPENIERELLTSHKLYVRVITWNLCARPPPPREKLTNLIPTNRCNASVVSE